MSRLNSIPSSLEVSINNIIKKSNAENKKTYRNRIVKLENTIEKYKYDNAKLEGENQVLRELCVKAGLIEMKQKRFDIIWKKYLETDEYKELIREYNESISQDT
jgi:hypothetical protein